MIETSALYELEPIGVGGKFESNGTVYHFCNNGPFGCREQFLRTHREQFLKERNTPLMCGTSIDCIPDMVCDQCATLLPISADTTTGAEIASRL